MLLARTNGYFIDLMKYNVVSLFYGPCEQKRREVLANEMGSSS